MSTHIFKAILPFLCSVFLTLTAFGQCHPADGAHLNYTSVCFRFPWMKNADSYELTLTNDRTGTTKKFAFLSNEYVISGLTGGESYTWTVRGNMPAEKTPLPLGPFHFSIDAEKGGDQYIRFKEVTYNKTRSGRELLVLDYALLAIDRNRNTVWYMPKVPYITPTSGVRDLKLTDAGTFLAIVDSLALEFDLSGKILWRAPNNGAVSLQQGEDYHHDIQLLPSGNYMVLGNEKVKHRFPGEQDSVRYESGTIIEYTPEGKVAWEWHAKDFFTESLLMQRRKADGTTDPATHMNAFHVSGSFIYAGFRDASWILKIDKKSKKVVELYGGRDSGLPNHYGTGLFRYQHDAQVLRDGSIAVVNNDSIKALKTFSSLVVFSQGEKGRRKGSELFRFPFNYDTLSPGKSTKLGNVTELRSGNYLVNMGAINRVFEVTPDGEVVWDFFVESLDTFKSVWRFAPQYRVSTTPSLYPNEFSARWETGMPVNNLLSGELTVTNVGSETNSYTVYLKQDYGHPLIEVGKVPALATNASSTVKLSISKKKFKEAMNGTTLVIQVDGKGKREEIVVN